MPKFNIQVCPVCNSSNFKPYLTCTDFFVSGEQFQLKKCKTCGFKITENIDDEDHIGRFYQSEEYISHSNTAKGLVNSVYHSVRKFMLGRKRNLVEKTTRLKTGHLLDVGTGTGFFLNAMKGRGWQVTGTEKSKEARDFAKKEFSLDNLPSDHLFSIKNNSFDAITLWHVLEHIHRLDENMSAFQRLLKRNGSLIIAAPNHGSFDAKHYREFWAAYDVPRHIWHFNPKQMKLFGEKHGFKLKSLHAMPFDSFYVSILSEKYKKSKLAFLKGIYYGKISWLKSMFNPAKSSSVVYVFVKN